MNCIRQMNYSNKRSLRPLHTMRNVVCDVELIIFQRLFQHVVIFGTTVKISFRRSDLDPLKLTTFPYNTIVTKKYRTVWVSGIQMVNLADHLNTGHCGPTACFNPVSRPPLEYLMQIYSLNTRLVWYSDGCCIPTLRCIGKNGKQTLDSIGNFSFIGAIKHVKQNNIHFQIRVLSFFV